MPQFSQQFVKESEWITPLLVYHRNVRTFRIFAVSKSPTFPHNRITCSYSHSHSYSYSYSFALLLHEAVLQIAKSHHWPDRA